MAEHSGLSAGLGSPPPMRGKVIFASCHLAEAGITPAHAGKRPSRFCRRVLLKDHPRPCGEKCILVQKMCDLVGSPPPMRGKVFQAILTLLGARITPAHAGKSRPYMVTLTQRKDHPRPCGEKPPKPLSRHGARGSPPPMRGKVLRQPYSILLIRITPAHAGKSSPS